MTFLDYLMIVLAAAALIVMAVALLKTKKPLKMFLSSAGWGLAALAVLSLTGSLTGLTLQITPYTLLTSSVFGLPGVLCITLTKIIWGL